MKKLFLVLLFFLGSFLQNSEAAIKSYRWTNQYGLSDNLQAILVPINQSAGLNLTYSDFLTYEHRNMANYRFTTFLQTSQGLPIRGALIRTWADLKDGHLIQMEADIEDGATSQARLAYIKQLSLVGTSIRKMTSSLDTMKFVRKVVLSHPDDKFIGKITEQDQWDGSSLERFITVKGKRGLHKIVVSHILKEVISQSYEPYPNADIQALVFPIYEETDKTHQIQERIPVTLQHILPVKKKVEGDPFASLRAKHYYEHLMDPILGETIDGQARGFWSYPWLIGAIQTLYDALPWEANTFENGGMILEGKYATVSLHPDVSKLSGLKFSLVFSGHANFSEKEAVTDSGMKTWEMIPTTAYRGQLLTDANSALNRVARRLPDHDVTTYINDGFDEIQVYYAINTLMDSLHGMGFSDPELSTRPFHAFLYDPDVSMKDNAYYTGDTINFTTYSPGNQNFARDNSTIWHELGHGVMDRLMGDYITLADTGGLSEGMADFVAQMVVEDVTKGVPFAGKEDFRIINHTAFNLTNEVHDDGEAYGGAMRDILELAMEKYGHQEGLKKMTDLTLEAMRLTRNHPALTANGWFEHMLFADTLGSPVRKSGDMGALVTKALGLRNFRMDNGEVADMRIMVDGDTLLTGQSVGSRGNPNRVELKGNETASFDLALNLKSAGDFQFQYPIKVEANYNGGPLEGAVKWVGEENGPQVFTLNNEKEVVHFKVAARAGCDFVNRPDGSCSDFVYIKIYNNGEKDPVAKKRFYVRVSAAE